MEITASQFIRSLRGTRSQRALSRRLGYSSNPVALWETGRRFPTAAEALRIGQVVGIDIHDAIHRFSPAAAASFDDSDAGVAAWLDALRGETPVRLIAERIGATRYSVARWLSGSTRPRLPDFFRLLDGLTGRLTDFVTTLVDIRTIPALQLQKKAEDRARRLSQEQPWTAAILVMLETHAYAELECHDDGWLARCLDIDIDIVVDVLGSLEAARIIEKRERRYVVLRELRTYSRGQPTSTRKKHWTTMAMQRMSTPREGDYFTFVVGSLSREDFGLLRHRLRKTLRETLAQLASSEPEMVALANIQLVGWDPDNG